MRTEAARSATTPGVVASLVWLALLPAGASATALDFTEPLECGPLGAGSAAAAARLPAGTPVASEPYVEEAYERGP